MMAHEAWTYYTGPSPLELFELPSDSKSKLDVSIDELIGGALQRYGHGGGNEKQYAIASGNVVAKGTINLHGTKNKNELKAESYCFLVVLVVVKDIHNVISRRGRTL
jgi:hypothetical protein